ncbi:MAG: serine hydrolase domain-containing protein [Gemmatimonadota bacterium]
MKGRHQRWGAYVVVLLFLNWPQLVFGQTTTREWEETLAEFAQQLARDVYADGIGGISAGVVVGRDLVWAQGFGWSDVGRRIPAGVNSVYRVGSISKSFTAVALLQLWERGYLGLDDSVGEVLPELDQMPGRPAGAEPITFRHLASHTAGLIREPELEGAAEGPLELWEDKILASIPTTSFYTSPGESFRYSNIGFGILGYSLSRISGIPFMELVDAGIIRPLGMHSSGFVVTPAIAEQLATGYVLRGDGTVDSRTPYLEHVGRGYKVPNGGVYSTVGDLGRFIAGLTGAASAPILGSEGRRLIRTSQTPENGAQYSFGFFISQREGSPDLIGHGGSVAGYNAHLVFEPESGIGVVLLRNYGGGETDLGRAAQELLWRLVEVGFSPR